METKEFEQQRLKDLMSYKKEDIIRMYDQTLSHLRNIVTHLDLWECPKCGNWSRKSFVCHHCLFDPSDKVNF